MPYCFAPGCNHVSRRETCRFFRFPTNEKIFKKWKTLCRRKDRDPTREDRLCSCHFANEKDVVPSIFAHNSNKRFDVLYPEKPKSSRTKKQMSAEEDVIVERETVVQDVSTNQPTVCQANANHDVLTNAENYFLQQENQKLKQCLAKGEYRLSFENIQANDLLVFQYTGLPTAAHFHVLVELISRFEINYFMGWKVEIINVSDQLLCTLMKFRLNLQYFDLGYRFKISSITVQNIFITFLNILHDILFTGMMEVIPSREKNTFFIPTCFAPFPNIKIVLDCTEIEIAIPASMKEQKAVFSHYKQRHTFKVLIGIAPNATITYVSDLFPGSSSDKAITKDCGIQSHMVAGDLILCDKGFLISDLCAPLGVNVNIPPFLTTTQFSKEQVLETRQIARARIHVDRAISRLKSFRILDFLQPNMRMYACKIMQTCAALVNMQYSLLKENEQCFSNEDPDKLSTRVPNEDVRKLPCTS